MLNSEHYWIEKNTSAAATPLNIDHVVPAGQEAFLRYLYVESSDGSRVAWSLERPNGTTILVGYTPYFTDFGLGGFLVPGTPGDDLRLAITAGGAGVVTKGFMIGIDKPR